MTVIYQIFLRTVYQGINIENSLFAIQRIKNHNILKIFYPKILIQNFYF